MDYSTLSEREIWPFLKAKKNKISETGMVTPTKIGLHAFYINIYLHEFSEPILFFDPRGLWSEREIWQNLKRSKISDTGVATPTKIDLHAYHINLYLHEFFEPILFSDPHGVKGKFGPFLKTNKKEQNLRNQRGHAHQIGLHAFHINLYLHEFFEPILFLTPGKSLCLPLVPTQKINKFCKLIVAYVNEVTTIGHVPECLPD